VQVETPQPQDFDMTLNLSEAQEAPAEPQADELLLGGLEAPVEMPPIAEPAMPRLGQPLEAPAAKPAAGGSTLFERMANLSRGSRDDDGGDDGSALNIPRFLGRQNNQ
jgi:cell division protein FtsZ